MAETKIPETLIDAIKDPGAGVENENRNPSFDPDFESLKESIGWVCGIADNIMKENGLIGFGEIGPEEYSKQAARVAQKNFPALLKQRSPEAALTLATIGLIGLNYKALKKQQAKNLELEKTGSDE